MAFLQTLRQLVNCSSDANRYRLNHLWELSLEDIYGKYVWVHTWFNNYSLNSWKNTWTGTPTTQVAGRFWRMRSCSTMLGTLMYVWEEWGRDPRKRPFPEVRSWFSCAESHPRVDEQSSGQVRNGGTPQGPAVEGRTLGCSSLEYRGVMSCAQLQAVQSYILIPLNYLNPLSDLLPSKPWCGKQESRWIGRVWPATSASSWGLLWGAAFSIGRW